jgi:hypothetical protein
MAAITQMTIHFTVIYRNHLNILNRMADFKSPSISSFFNDETASKHQKKLLSALSLIQLLKVCFSGTVLINPLLVVEHIAGPGVLEVFLWVVVLRVFDAIL